MSSRRWIALAALALGCATASLTPEQRQRADSASRLVELLRAARTEEVAASLHYPPFYTAGERARDEADVQRSLDFLLERFGAISRFEALKVNPSTLDLGISGGTPQYLASLGSIQIADIPYAVTCARTGEAVVRVTFMQTSNGWEPWKISFGFPASRPDARAQIGEIARELAEHMQERELSL